MKRSEELLELDKILSAAAGFAVLEASKAYLTSLSPVHELAA